MTDHAQKHEEIPSVAERSHQDLAGKIGAIAEDLRQHTQGPARPWHKALDKSATIWKRHAADDHGLRDLAVEVRQLRARSTSAALQSPAAA